MSGDDVNWRWSGGEKLGGGTCERIEDGWLRCGYAGRAEGLRGRYSEECEVDF